MPHSFRSLLLFSSILILLYTASSCHSSPAKVSADYADYTFDPKVMEKLPLYDSLVSSVLANYPAFEKHISEKNSSYRSYRYMPLSKKEEVFTTLPAEAAAHIQPHIDSLGNNFFYGFDLFKDSSVKVYIRSNFSGKLQAEVEENLSYYPQEKVIRKREFPVKDTVLNNHWQYWIDFQERGLF